MIDNRVFASIAYLNTSLDSRLMLDSIDGVEGDSGIRATVGVNFSDAIGRTGVEVMEDGDISGILLFVVPQQIEVGWTRSAGSDRVGATLSWGI